MNARRSAPAAFLTGSGAFVEADTSENDAVALVMTLHRFLDAALRANDPNEIARAADEALPTLRANASSIAFLRGEVFVGGKLLAAPRSVLESALAIGAALDRAGAGEMWVEANVVRDGLVAFARALAAVARDPSRASALLDARLAGIGARAIDPSVSRAERRDLAPREQVLEAYASAIVVGREVRAAATAGIAPPLARLKRVAQRFVELSGEHEPAFVGVTTLAPSHRDDAGRAAQTAMLSVAIARQITTDRRTLARLALAALTFDMGAGSSIANGGIAFASALRAVVASEGAALERAASGADPRGIAALYDGGHATPRLESAIVFAARAFLEGLAPASGERGKAPLDVLARIGELREMDAAVFRCLVRAIGVAPIGSVVELDDGAWAVVVGDSLAGGVNLDRPRVRVVTTAAGRALEEYVEIDLGKPANKARRIARVVEPEEARFNVARVFFG